MTVDKKEREMITATKLRNDAHKDIQDLIALPTQTQTNVFRKIALYSGLSETGIRMFLIGKRFDPKVSTLTALQRGISKFQRELKK